MGKSHDAGPIHCGAAPFDLVSKTVSHPRTGEGNFSSRWARYGKIKYLVGRIIIYSQSELSYTVSWIQSADLARGPYVAHPCPRSSISKSPRSPPDYNASVINVLMGVREL